MSTKASPAKEAPDQASQPLADAKADLFKALANPARIRIVEVLGVGTFSVGEIQLRLGLEPSHLSQQLGVLRRAGLVTGTRRGTSVIYSLKDPAVSEVLAVAKRVLLSSLEETSSLLADLASETEQG